MNSKTQAQKGFKTFILTLAISLAVFSGIYYIINSNDSVDTASVVPEETGENVLDAKTGMVEEESTTLGDQDRRAENEDKSESVFEDLANRRIGGPGGEVAAAETSEDDESEVLAGADVSTQETTESTVPDTGIAGPTTGIILTLIIFSLVMYVYFIGPRKIALSSFEKDVLDDLD